MIETEYDVIVAGYGPVGETCANLLGYYGIKALILDKEKGHTPYLEQLLGMQNVKEQWLIVISVQK